jgi:hypothetical protein
MEGPIKNINATLPDFYDQSNGQVFLAVPFKINAQIKQCLKQDIPFSGASFVTSQVIETLLYNEFKRISKKRN